MNDQTKIVIAGIGGVGGYFGGLLAQKYTGGKELEIDFIARGKHLAQIKDRGLSVIKGATTFIAKPHLATANTAEIGIADYVLICTKNYDLDEIVLQLKPCLGSNTIIIPFLNGVEGVEKIRAHLPNHLVVAGCAYIVSAIKEPGVIENIGSVQKLYFGLDHKSDDRLVKLENILKSANIDATFSQNISTVVWEKFIFLSCIATATSYFDKCIGKLLAENHNTLISLLEEVTAIAIVKGIKIDQEIKARAMAHYKALPYEATSSMHRDYINLKPQTELNSLTGYVVRAGQELNVETPIFNKAYQQLLNK